MAYFFYIGCKKYNNLSTHLLTKNKMIMNTNVWFFDDVNLFKILCPHKYPVHTASHKLSTYKKSDYIYFEEDSANKIYLIDMAWFRASCLFGQGGSVVDFIAR